MHLKEYIPTMSMMVALGMILATLIVLHLTGAKPESPVLLGLVSAASGMAGAIGGFSMQHQGRPSSISDSPGAKIYDGDQPK